MVSRENLYQFNKNKLCEYRIKLKGQFQYINRPAEFFLDFTNDQIRLRYYSEHNFGDYLDQFDGHINTLVKGMDADIRRYWEGSITHLLEFHTKLIKQFFTEGAKRESSEELTEFMQPKHGRFHMIALDLFERLDELEKYQYTGTNSIKNWSVIDAKCTASVTKAIKSYLEVLQILEKNKQENQELIREIRRYGLILARIGVSAGSTILTGIPT